MKSSINMFGKIISLYGIFCLLGIACAVIVACCLAKRKNIEFFDFALVVIITLISAFIGAKLLFIIVSWGEVVQLFKQHTFLTAFSSLIRGGFVFYGGLVGGLVGLLITLKAQKKRVLEYLSIFAVVLPLGHAFGRIGCFFAGCCYGVEYDGLFGFKYTAPMDKSTPVNISLFPVQMVEALLLFILFVMLLIMYFKLKNKSIVIIGYALIYSVLRFGLEFLRGDKERGLLLNLSTSQWISVFIIGCVVICMVYNNIKILKGFKR